MPNVYCIDTSSLFELKRFDADVFESLWARLDGLIDQGRLIAPREVFREVEAGDDDVKKWCKARPQVFVDLDDSQKDALDKLCKKNPTLQTAIDEQTGPFADPLIVALCLAKSTEGGTYVVVTQEKLKGQGSLKIPNLCASLGLPAAISLMDMFKAEGFKF